MVTKLNKTGEFQNWAVPSHRKLLKVLDIQKLEISVSSIFQGDKK